MIERPDWRQVWAVMRAISSSTRTSSASSLPTSWAASRFLGLRISAVMWYGSERRLGLLVNARMALMVCESASSVSAARMMMLRAACGLTISRSVRSIGLPLRQTTRVVLVLGTLSRISSSISTLSLSARMATQARGRFSLAITSSVTMAKTCSDQPRMTVWFSSTTKERPLRSSWMRSSMPLLRMPISKLTTKMPTRVMKSIGRRKPQPWSPPMVPGSRVRIRLAQAASMKFNGPSSGGPSPRTVITMATMRMINKVATKSMPIMAGVPLDIRLSNL